MNYLTQIILPSELAAKQKLLENFQWYGEVWKYFPRRPNSAKDFLFRMDRYDKEVRVTLASNREPRRPGWCPAKAWECRNLNAAEPNFYELPKYRFKVCLNPTRTTRDNPNKNARVKKQGRHEAILKAPELREWFYRKAVENGFKVLAAPEINISPPVFHRFLQAGHQSTIVGVDFRGTLEVTDKPLFKKVCGQGIGRSRSFGFGLLVIQPINKI